MIPFDRKCLFLVSMTFGRQRVWKRSLCVSDDGYSLEKDVAGVDAVSFSGS